MILLDILKFLTIDVETDPLANCRRHFVAAEKNKIMIIIVLLQLFEILIIHHRCLQLLKKILILVVFSFF